MGYRESLEAAGAKVLEYESFGSYQGDWLAKVEYEGKTGWVQGSYGSCSGCDAFEAEFGWDDSEKLDYQERLANFGREYLDCIMTQEDAEHYASRNLKWDMDAQEMLDFIKDNAIYSN